jgi:hypothetical protein
MAAGIAGRRVADAANRAAFVLRLGHWPAVCGPLRRHRHRADEAPARSRKAGIESEPTRVNMLHRRKDHATARPKRREKFDAPRILDDRQMSFRIHRAACRRTLGRHPCQSRDVRARARHGGHQDRHVNSLLRTADSLRGARVHGSHASQHCQVRVQQPRSGSVAAASGHASLGAIPEARYIEDTASGRVLACPRSCQRRKL